jgi:hypothetical protein
MGRINKGLRLRQDVLDRAAHLRTYHPEHETEAAMLNVILYHGLLLMEAEVLAGGGAPPPEYTEQQIIAMVVLKLLPSLQLLMRAGVLALPIQSSGTQAGHAIAADTHDNEIDVQTGEDLGRLGSNFL